MARAAFLLRLCVFASLRLIFLPNTAGEKMIRKLNDLVSVGPETMKDFAKLKIKTVRQLAKQQPHLLYKKLCALTCARHDPCVEDVFAAAIAQARNPDLPEKEKQWPYWSRLRKARPIRCAWVPVGNELYERYHDTEWGVPVHEDRIHFEFLILEAAQAGLSWLTVLKKRAAYAKAFANFDWKKVAAFDESDVERLMKNPGIIRNRAKILAAINNAKQFIEVRKEFGTFDTYIWKFVKGKPLQPKRKSIAELPSVSEEAVTLSQDLKRRGFKFLGPTVVYAHMQATGLVNDHTVDCFCHTR